MPKTTAHQLALGILDVPIDFWVVVVAIGLVPSLTMEDVVVNEMLVEENDSSEEVGDVMEGNANSSSAGLVRADPSSVGAGSLLFACTDVGIDPSAIALTSSVAIGISALSPKIPGRDVIVVRPAALLFRPVHIPPGQHLCRPL